MRGTGRARARLGKDGPHAPSALREDRGREVDAGGAARPRGRGGSNAQLERFTGEVGQKVVDGLRERIERGDFGIVLKDAGSAGAPNRGRGMGAQGQYGSGAEMGDEENFGGGFNTGAQGDMRGAGGNRGAGGPTQLAPGVTLMELAPEYMIRLAEDFRTEIIR